MHFTQLFIFHAHSLLASIYSLLFCIFSNAEIPRYSNASSSKSVSQVSSHWCCHCRVIGNSLPRASPRHPAFPSNQEDEDGIMTGDDGASVCAFATTKYWDRIKQIRLFKLKPHVLNSGGRKNHNRTDRQFFGGHFAQIEKEIFY